MDFVRNNSDFSDYDFEASGLNFVADLLAYNTQYNSFYLNQVASEMFLDTAQQRKNVVSDCKTNGLSCKFKEDVKSHSQYEIVDITGAQGAVNLPSALDFLAKKSMVNLIHLLQHKIMFLVLSTDSIYELI